MDIFGPRLMSLPSIRHNLVRYQSQLCQYSFRCIGSIDFVSDRTLLHV